MMSIAERVAQITAALPIEKQAEVLDFVEFLRARSGREGPPEQAGPPRRERRLGTLAGAFTIADDFDAPLPEEIQRYFDGEDDGVLGKPR